MPAGQHHRHDRLRVDRQCLLRSRALITQVRDCGRDRGIVWVEVVEAAEGAGDVAEDRSVEVDAAEPFYSLRCAEDGEAVARRAQHGCVEGASAEVVDSDGLPGLDSFGAGVVDRGRFWLGQQADRRGSRPRQAGEVHRLLEEVLLVGPPVRRVGDRDRRGHLALAVRDGVDDPAQQLRGEELRGVRCATDEDRSRVTDAPLELARDPLRFGEHSPLSGLADQDRPVGPDVHDRGDRGLTCAQVDDRRALASPHRRGGPRGTEIDPELVGHAPTPVTETPRRLGAA